MLSFDICAAVLLTVYIPQAISINYSKQTLFQRTEVDFCLTKGQITKSQSPLDADCARECSRTEGCCGFSLNQADDRCLLLTDPTPSLRPVDSFSGRCGMYVRSGCKICPPAFSTTFKESLDIGYYLDGDSVENGTTSWSFCEKKGGRVFEGVTPSVIIAVGQYLQKKWASATLRASSAACINTSTPSKCHFSLGASLGPGGAFVWKSSGLEIDLGSFALAGISFLSISDGAALTLVVPFSTNPSSGASQPYIAQHGLALNSIGICECQFRS